MVTFRSSWFCNVCVRAFGCACLMLVSPGVTSDRSGPSFRKIRIDLCALVCGSPERSFLIPRLARLPRRCGPHYPCVRSLGRRIRLDLTDYPGFGRMRHIPANCNGGGTVCLAQYGVRGKFLPCGSVFRRWLRTDSFIAGYGVWAAAVGGFSVAHANVWVWVLLFLLTGLATSIIEIGQKMATVRIVSEATRGHGSGKSQLSGAADNCCQALWQGLYGPWIKFLWPLPLKV